MCGCNLLTRLCMARHFWLRIRECMHTEAQCVLKHSLFCVLLINIDKSTEFAMTFVSEELAGAHDDDVLAQFVCIFDSTKRSICEIINTELKPFYEKGRVQKHEKRTFWHRTTRWLAIELRFLFVGKLLIIRMFVVLWAALLQNTF